ncbi:MAG: recombination protein recr c4-type zinc finger [Verrucomicrobiales bacterium]|nr:recombination protein recr c4-type zinc finger [Verrucomicrobiales bacterium]
MIPAVGYPDEIRALIAQLKRLPGVGPRSAERIALWLLRSRQTPSTDLATALNQAQAEIELCPVCGFFASRTAGCTLCGNSDRDVTQLCVVEQATDVLPLERTGAFRGHYHALHGRLSPLDNIGPEDLRIDTLMQRLREGFITEVILATGSDVEGEATANYLAGALGASFPGLTVTRLAQGLPAGGGLDSADDLTLLRALSGRRRLAAH